MAVGALSVTFRCWCASHEGLGGKSPLYILELYPYTLQPHRGSSLQLTIRAMRAIGNYLWNGGSTDLSLSGQVWSCIMLTEEQNQSTVPQYRQDKTNP